MCADNIQLGSCPFEKGSLFDLPCVCFLCITVRLLLCFEGENLVFTFRETGSNYLFTPRDFKMGMENFFS